MNPIDMLERELVAAAARGPRQRRPSGRALLLAAALVVLVAVPAWATGLLRDVFPQSRPPDFGPGVPTGQGQRDYLVAGGTTARGERWRVTVERNGLLRRRGGHTFDCYALTIGPPPQGGGGACVYDQMTRGLAADGVTTGRVSRHDPRTFVHFVTARQNDRIAVRLNSGRRFFVRPLQIDQAKLRRTGLRFPFGVVAFVIPHGDRLRGIAAIDVHGRVTASFLQPARVPASARVLQSPAL